MARLTSTRCSGEGCCAIITAAVAATSDSSTKKCQGRKAFTFSGLAGPHPRSLSLGGFAPRSGRRRFSALVGSASRWARSRPSIEVAELIVQARVQRGIACRRGVGALRRGGGGRRSPPRPPRGGERQTERARRAGQV